jgi:hypothetical protein
LDVAAVPRLLARSGTGCQSFALNPIEGDDELHPTNLWVDFVGMGGSTMPVYSDDPMTQLDDEGARSGDTITFTVDSHPAVPLGPDPPVWTGAGERVHVELEACPLFGDPDCDVDVADIMKVASRWRCQLGDGCYDSRCDLNGNGDIDIVDIMRVAVHWGQACSP